MSTAFFGFTSFFKGTVEGEYRNGDPQPQQQQQQQRTSSSGMLALLEQQQRIREFRAAEIEEDKEIADRKVKLAENYVSLDKRLNAREDRRMRKARVDELKHMRLVPVPRRRKHKPASAAVALARQQEQLLAACLEAREDEMARERNEAVAMSHASSSKERARIKRRFDAQRVRAQVKIKQLTADHMRVAQSKYGDALDAAQAEAEAAAHDRQSREGAAGGGQPPQRQRHHTMAVVRKPRQTVVSGTSEQRRMRTSNNAADSGPAFVPSAKFDGARDGHSFKMGDDGLGYYRDLRPAPGGAGIA
eukprot:g909.t1